MPRLGRIICGFISLGAASMAASAQLSTATAFGNVTDPTGAQIPYATVVFTQTETNFTRTTTTNGQGEYHSEFLPVGPYIVKVDAAGFKESVHSGIVLSVTQQAALNFSASTWRANCHCQCHQSGSPDQSGKFGAGPHGRQSRNRKSSAGGP